MLDALSWPPVHFRKSKKQLMCLAKIQEEFVELQNTGLFPVSEDCGGKRLHGTIVYMVIRMVFTKSISTWRRILGSSGPGRIVHTILYVKLFELQS